MVNENDMKCPLCGGMLLEKICIDCGFECLTEDEIASPYDFVPDNDKFGESEPSDDNAEMESISAVYNEQKSEITAIPQINNSVPKKAAPKPYSVSSYHGSTNTPAPSPSIVEMIVQDFVTAIKKHWWKMLLTLIFPMTGFFIGLAYCMLGSGGGRRKDASDFNFGLILKGICYMSAAGLLSKFGIGFSIL